MEKTRRSLRISRISGSLCFFLRSLRCEVVHFLLQKKAWRHGFLTRMDTERADFFQVKELEV